MVISFFVAVMSQEMVGISKTKSQFLLKEKLPAYTTDAYNMTGEYYRPSF